MINNLHAQALDIVSRYKKVEAELLEILDRIDKEKIYLKLSYGSLFEYSVKALHLSESVSANFVNVMRKSRSIPQLRAAIQSGALTVSKARKFTSVLTKDNQSEWLAMGQKLSSREIEKAVAKISPQQIPE